MRELGDPGSEGFHLTAYPFYVLNRVVSRYNVIIEAALRTIMIDIPTWRVLMILGESEPQPIAQIAKRAVINISTMARIVDRMIDADLIRAVASASDGRVTELALTAFGRKKLAAARLLTAPIYRQVIRGFSAPDFEQLLGLLNRLHDNLDSAAISSGDNGRPGGKLDRRHESAQASAAPSRARRKGSNAKRTRTGAD